MQPCAGQEAYVERRWKVSPSCRARCSSSGSTCSSSTSRSEDRERLQWQRRLRACPGCSTRYAAIASRRADGSAGPGSPTGSAVVAASIGLVIFTVGSALCGAAPPCPRWCWPVSSAAAISLLLPTLARAAAARVRPAERPTAIGIWSAVRGVAAAAGRPIGGLLVHVSWRLPCSLNGADRRDTPHLRHAPAARAAPRAKPSRPARRAALDDRHRSARPRPRQGAGLGLGEARTLAALGRFGQW